MTARSAYLSRDGHTYMFRYAAGEEAEVLEEFTRLAEDREWNLDWLDAATLSFQVTQQAANGCCDALIPTHGDGARTRDR